MDDGNRHQPRWLEWLGGSSQVDERLRQPVKWKNHYHPVPWFEYDEYRWGRLV
jgi:hypothetical protein